jgi:hypothetical protein
LSEVETPNEIPMPRDFLARLSLVKVIPPDSRPYQEQLGEEVVFEVVQLPPPPVIISSSSADKSLKNVSEPEKNAVPGIILVVILWSP